MRIYFTKSQKIAIILAKVNDVSKRIKGLILKIEYKKGVLVWQ